MKQGLQQHWWKFLLVLGLVILGGWAWQQFAGNPSAEIEPVFDRPIAKSTQPPPPPETRSSSTGNPDLVEHTPVNNTSPTPLASPTSVPVYHVVQAGEYPLTIAQLYNISVDTLLTINRITDPTRLQIGQKLLVPVTTTPTPAATPTPKYSPTPTPEPVYYTVKAGDTLLVIANEYDTSVEAIMLANELDNPHTLKIGQKLLIPPDGFKFNSPVVVHVIEGGDTFSHLSFYYGSTIDDILTANPGLEPTALQIGQKVIIPVTSPPVNPAANPRLPQITSPEPIAPGLAGLPQQTINLVNSRRQASGLPALKPDAQLATLALVHAQDMVKRGYFAHTTPEGITLDNRFAQQGVEAYWNGENIQRNTKPIEETAPYAITWFMNSAPHRANILHERFNSIGVGVVEEPPGWYTFVLVFAER